MVLTLLEVARVLGPPVALVLVNHFCRAHRTALVGGLRPLRRMHNLSMAAFSLKVFLELARVLHQRHASWRSLMCDASGMTAVRGWELSKYVELLDIAFVYAAGRSPSPLLLWHHATAGMAVAVNTVGRGDAPTPMYFVGSLLLVLNECSSKEASTFW